MTNSSNIKDQPNKFYIISVTTLTFVLPAIGFVEVIGQKVNGQWKIRTDFSCPYIDIGLKYIHYMPVNIVWENLRGLEKVDFRKAVGNEARQVGAKAKFEREHVHHFRK